MKEYNSYICMEVILKDGYRGDWRPAIDEALAVAQTNQVPVRLKYAGQVSFLIHPDMEYSKIEELKNKSFTIGV